VPNRKNGRKLSLSVIFKRKTMFFMKNGRYSDHTVVGEAGFLLPDRVPVSPEND
jgi:hypothetical protein